jgi:hypothetical protein
MDISMSEEDSTALWMWLHTGKGAAEQQVERDPRRAALHRAEAAVWEKVIDMVALLTSRRAPRFV